jgi:BirA family transcriptional regulator, biotin operon repressor / biotin---[acetyl-CoA-carboxylase] ligase
VSWEGASAEKLVAAWRVPAVHLFESVGSTNDVARALASEGAPAGTVVIADAQTAGRGRGGKAWASAPGLGLWMSIVLRPAELTRPGLLPILVGLAVAEALDPLLRPAQAQVKWPNDVLVGGRKVCGVLCEGILEPDLGASVIAGIGVNVGHAPADFPDEVAEVATSLRIAAGWSPSRVEVAGAIVASVLKRAGSPPAQLSGSLLTALTARDALAGREIRVEGAEPFEGVALGINAGGALLVRTGGALRTVHAGTVRLVR